MKLHRAFLIGTVVSLATAALLGIVALLGMSGNTTWRILGSVMSFGYFSLASLICAYTIDRRRLAWLAWVGLTWSWFAFGYTLLMLWFDSWMRDIISGHDEEEIMATGFYMSFFAAHVCLLWLPTRVEKWSRRVRWVATGSAILLALLVVDVLFEVTEFAQGTEESYARVAGAVAIVTASASIVFPLLLRFDRLRRQDEITTTELKIRVHCPRCGLDQTMISGKSRCKRCRLKFAIEIEEPTCSQCGYVLYRPAGNACPECGHDIPREDRWVDTDSSTSAVQPERHAADTPSHDEPSAYRKE